MAIRHLRQPWIAGLAAAGVALMAGVSMFATPPDDREPVAAPTARLAATTPARVTDAAAVARAPVAAAPAASRAPPGRLDYDSADDLYALASAAANSADLMTQLNGWHALRSCTWTPQTRVQYEALAAGGPSDATGRERKRAAGVVLRKCAGFFNNDASANDELRKRLRERLLAHDGEYVAGISQGGPNDKQIIAAIGRGDWQTFAGATHLILPRVWARMDVAPDSEAALMFGVGAIQALCELGQDCSPNGLSYAIQCVNDGACPGSWEAFGSLGISAAQLVKVHQHRRAIVEAYLRQDAAYFGLKP